ncbi:MAG: cyclic nucleotide-binding domain-containing protein, partial [Bdellovibrionaceae bacterium]|nr:cyclic nucleotide-binding domain-containing protein [Pseudobdellovibrionaceae bacterium]
PLSLARAELTKRGHMRGPGAAPSVSAKINGLFVTAAIIGLCASFAAIADAAVGAAHTLLPPFPTYVVGGGIATLLSLIPFGWAFLILTDLMAAIESLADDLELLNPVRDQIQQVWTWLRAGRTQSELRKIRTSLDRHPLFLSLAPQMRESLCLGARLISAPRGARLIRQGSRSTDLYLLVRGSVGVYRRDSMTQQSEMVLRLSSGSVFGEAGFFLDQERTADIVALEGCEVIKMARPAAFKPQENVNAQDGFRKKIWASQVLSGHPIFQRLPAEAILHILNFSEILTLPPRHWLMREGEASDGLWILIQGSAAVSVRGAARPDVSSGAVLGEIGLLWNSPRTASVHATSECVALKLSAPAFRSLVSRNLNFGARLQELGADRLERDRQSA